MRTECAGQKVYGDRGQRQQAEQHQAVTAELAAQLLERDAGDARFAEILLVGEINPYDADPRHALYHEPERSAGGRLCRLVCELRPSTYLAMHRANLCTEKWSAPAARARAERLAGAVTPSTPWRVIVLLGRKVAGAFEQALRSPAGALQPFESYTHDASGLRLLCLPHPSGLNREWNVPGAFERARAALREVAPAIPWGEATASYKIKMPPTEPHDAGGYRQ